ncbi:hydroxypyruvate isomerase family protein [Luteitalea sp.]|jgi:hydroxypyruvate isomerase|uniref:hydroxypyruvate isomerase family protein n=1 Tax=Luteitalea sp. TaxID=2004800 RepID=UPI0037CC1E97
MSDVTRRELLGAAALTAAGAALPAVAGAQAAKPGAGRLKQSVCRWCYNKIPLADFFKACAEMGLPAIDLLTEEEWTIAKRDFGLVCSTGFPAVRSIPDGINNTKFHDGIVASLTEMIPKAAKAGVPNVITFFGNRRGQDLEEAKANSVACLNRIKGIAEAEGVTVVVELLNSKVNHKDYIGDHTAYGVDICKRVGSPRIKLLYDIYHMQIMEGDILRTMGENWDYIGHLHTGGVPGRNELDDTQELQWRSIAKWVADKGYQGYFAHEFIPTRDPLTSLREAVQLCNV